MPTNKSLDIVKLSKNTVQFNKFSFLAFYHVKFNFLTQLLNTINIKNTFYILKHKLKSFFPHNKIRRINLAYLWHICHNFTTPTLRCYRIGKV